VQTVIQFLNAQNVCPTEIYCHLIAVYGEGVMNESNMRKQSRMFNEGRTNVHDEVHPGAHLLSLRTWKTRLNNTSGQMGISFLFNS
jgi:hypothetical protein